ncbi:hypothetical protein ACJX0J_023808, partial [Zea mays]
AHLKCGVALYPSVWFAMSGLDYLWAKLSSCTSILQIIYLCLTLVFMLDLALPIFWNVLYLLLDAVAASNSIFNCNFNIFKAAVSLLAARFQGSATKVIGLVLCYKIVGMWIKDSIFTFTVNNIIKEAAFLEAATFAYLLLF